MVSLQFITHQTERYSYLESARMALEGGCKWIQLRMKEARHRISDKWNDEKPALNELQSQEILMGLTSGVDVSLYADPRYTFKEMEKIRLALERGSNLDGLLKYGC